MMTMTSAEAARWPNLIGVHSETTPTTQRSQQHVEHQKMQSGRVQQLIAEVLNTLAASATYVTLGNAEWNKSGRTINLEVYGRTLNINLISPELTRSFIVTPRNRTSTMADPHSEPYVKALAWIKEATTLSDQRIGELLGVSRQTIVKWQKGIKPHWVHKQRLLAIHSVIQQAAIQHKSPDALTAWLDTPRGTRGQTPADMLINRQIDRARRYAVSSSSSKIRRPPAWILDPVPEKYKASIETRQEPSPPFDEDELTAFFAEEPDNAEE